MLLEKRKSEAIIANNKQDKILQRKPSFIQDIRDNHKNSNNTFKVIGLNLDKKICWVREWPFALSSKKTFAVEISQITLQMFCSNLSSK